jgi:hypothetical protein
MPRKDDEEELLLLWLRAIEMKLPFVPTRVKTKRQITSLQKKMGKGLGSGYKFRYSSYPEGIRLERGEYPHEGFVRAMFEYAYLALLDPTNIPEASVWASTLGVSYRVGMLVTLAKGLIIGPPLLAIVDPQDRWAGGLDESQLYQSIEADIKYGFELGWSQSPANPANMPNYTHRLTDLNYSGGYKYSGLY